MDLLMMISPILVDGGLGGKAGRNGRAGSGGPGGRGGSSHSWTTTSYSYYTDSNGHRQTRSHTDYHSNPGGIDGPYGPDGYPGNAHTYCGVDGQKGSFEYIVEHTAGVVKYLDKYDLKMEDFVFIFPEEDQVIEPGEKGVVISVTLYNKGLMPSPYHQDLFISLVDTENLEGIGTMQIPRIIPPQ